MIHCLLNVWLSLQLTKYVWQNISYFYAGLGVSTPEPPKNQAQAQHPAHTPQVRVSVLQTVSLVAELAPKFTLTLQGPAGREEGWERMGSPSGKHCCSLPGRSLHPFTWGRGCACCFTQLRRWPGFWIGQENLGHTGGSFPIYSAIIFKISHLSMIKTHSKCFFSNKEVRLPLGFLSEIWILEAVLPSGFAVDWSVLTWAVWDPLFTAHSFRAPDTGSTDTLAMTPTILQRASRGIVCMQVCKYQQPIRSKATWVTTTELLNWRHNVTPLGQGWGHFATAVPLDWGVPCCPPSPELLQSHLGVTTWPETWEPLESHQTHQDSAFSLMSGEILLLNKRAQDQNFSFNPGPLLWTH